MQWCLTEMTDTSFKMQKWKLIALAYCARIEQYMQRKRTNYILSIYLQEMAREVRSDQLLCSSGLMRPSSYRTWPLFLPHIICVHSSELGTHLPWFRKYLHSNWCLQLILIGAFYLLQINVVEPIWSSHYQSNGWPLAASFHLFSTVIIVDWCHLRLWWINYCTGKKPRDYDHEKDDMYGFYHPFAFSVWPCFWEREVKWR